MTDQPDSDEASQLHGTLVYCGNTDPTGQSLEQGFYFRHFNPTREPLSSVYGMGPTFDTWDYTYSNNGRYLFFKEGFRGWGYCLDRLDLKTHAIVMSRGLHDERVAYSPDGRYVALKMGGDGGHNQDEGPAWPAVFDFESQTYMVVSRPWGSSLSEMAWTPRDTLLYTDKKEAAPSKLNPVDAKLYTAWGLWEYDPANRTSRPVLPGAARPVVSPDGRWVVFQRASLLGSADNSGSNYQVIRWNRAQLNWLWDRQNNFVQYLGGPDYNQAQWTTDGSQLIVVKAGPDWRKARNPVSADLVSLDMWAFESRCQTGEPVEPTVRPVATILARSSEGSFYDQSAYFRLLRLDGHHAYVRIQEFFGRSKYGWITASNVTAVNISNGNVTKLAQVNDSFATEDWIPDTANSLLAEESAVAPMPDNEVPQSPVPKTTTSVPSATPAPAVDSKTK